MVGVIEVIFVLALIGVGALSVVSALDARKALGPVTESLGPQGNGEGGPGPEAVGTQGLDAFERLQVRYGYLDLLSETHAQLPESLESPVGFEHRPLSLSDLEEQALPQLFAENALDVAEVPVHMFLHSLGPPTPLRVVGLSFMVGVSPAKLCVVRGRELRNGHTIPLADPQSIDIDDLRGLTVSVVGQYMTPTLNLERVLEDVLIPRGVTIGSSRSVELWDQDSIQILYASGFDEQIEQLTDGSADIALVLLIFHSRLRDLLDDKDSRLQYVWCHEVEAAPIVLEGQFANGPPASVLVTSEAVLRDTNRRYSLAESLRTLSLRNRVLSEDPARWTGMAATWGGAPGLGHPAGASEVDGTVPQAVEMRWDVFIDDPDEFLSDIRELRQWAPSQRRWAFSDDALRRVIVDRAELENVAP